MCVFSSLISMPQKFQQDIICLLLLGECMKSVPNSLLHNQFYECSVKAQRLHTYSSLPCATWFWPMGCKWKRHVLLRQRIPLLSFYSVLLARMKRIYPSIHGTIYIWSSHLHMVPWDGSHMYRIGKNGLKPSFRATLSVLEYLCLHCFIWEKFMPCASHYYFNVYKGNETSILIPSGTLIVYIVGY